MMAAAAPAAAWNTCAVVTEFKQLREFAKKKGNKGRWVLDEYVLKWEEQGKPITVYYHKAYPGGLLADGKPAPPPYPGFPEAVAAGMA
jgi:hypothetical protein